MRRRISLHITISTLFITLTLIMGAVLSWQGYLKTSDIIISSAQELNHHISRELAATFDGTIRTLQSSLGLFRLSPVTRAVTVAQRLQHLDAFRAVLESDSTVSAVGVGYANGDFLRLKRHAAVQDDPGVPAGTVYIANHVTASAAAEHRFYYDAQLRELSRTEAIATDYDARQRSWYRQATDTITATAPYMFYESGQLGLTAMTVAPVDGVVVMLDITLDHLGQVIQQYRITPSTEALLVNANGDVIAHQHDSGRSATASNQQGEKTLMSLAELDSPVLSYLATRMDPDQQVLDIMFAQRRWVGTINPVARPGGEQVYALIISPLDELLGEAVTMRWQMFVFALGVLLFFVPVIWFASRRISRPLKALSAQAEAISRFDFSRTRQSHSMISEVAQLDATMSMMKATITRFVDLINSLAGERNLDNLLQEITRETMAVINSNAALIYLLDENDDSYRPHLLTSHADQDAGVDGLPVLDLSQLQSLSALQADNRVKILSMKTQHPLSILPAHMGYESVGVIPVTLNNRSDETIGVLLYIFTDQQATAGISQRNIDFVSALSGFVAVTLESRQLFEMQEALLHAFIKLIAGAIDAKSPYTGGHCQRVPEITLMLARAACDSDDPHYKDFNLDENAWQALNIASWLHDCGKVTTPEYVVDKATKLETIYDRIHEIRTRFEVLKRDAEIDCWQQIAEGGDRAALLEKLEHQKAVLDEEFAFIAECNQGGEFMAEDKLHRLEQIAARCWQRTLDDRLGLSWEEQQRKPESGPLPVEEKLIADKPEHLITRAATDVIADDNPWGFKVDTPKYKYNRGELYNLGIQRGTLTEEERYIINGHMIETIKMLTRLPYPKHLRQVPLLAGSHHETMDGKGYPKKLLMSEQPLAARMMVIADIFEALTASDRPYKKAKTLSESLKIMSFMRNDQHIDPDLFELFLRSGVFRDYAEQYLDPEQIDAVTIDDYL